MELRLWPHGIHSFMFSSVFHVACPSAGKPLRFTHHLCLPLTRRVSMPRLVIRIQASIPVNTTLVRNRGMLLGCELNPWPAHGRSCQSPWELGARWPSPAGVGTRPLKATSACYVAIGSASMSDFPEASFFRRTLAGSIGGGCSFFERGGKVGVLGEIFQSFDDGCPLQLKAPMLD